MLFACFKDKEILFVVMKIINVEHIFLMAGKGIVSAWILNPSPPSHKPAISSVSPGT